MNFVLLKCGVFIMDIVSDVRDSIENIPGKNVRSLPRACKPPCVAAFVNAFWMLFARSFAHYAVIS